MTNAELAILGLVAEAPRHGYEIEQLIENRGMRNWTEVGFSSIYYILNKLEQRSLIRSHREPAAGRGVGDPRRNSAAAGALHRRPAGSDRDDTGNRTTVRRVSGRNCSRHTKARHGGPAARAAWSDPAGATGTARTVA